jgi:hypothetical protein
MALALFRERTFAPDQHVIIERHREGALSMRSNTRLGRLLHLYEQGRHFCQSSGPIVHNAIDDRQIRGE